jgi:hypothetical protein
LDVRIAIVTKRNIRRIEMNWRIEWLQFTFHG